MKISAFSPVTTKNSYYLKTNKDNINFKQEAEEQRSKEIFSLGNDYLKDASNKRRICGIEHIAWFIDTTTDEKLRQEAIDILLERASADRYLLVRKRSLYGLTQIELRFDYQTRIKVLDRLTTMYAPHKSSEDRKKIIYSVYEIATSNKAQSELEYTDKLKYLNFLQDVAKNDENDEIKTTAADYAEKMKKSIKDNMLRVMKDI